MDPHDDVDDILRANRSREKQYVFDHIFSPEATQEDVYCAVVQEKGIIESVLSGYNCTVFAYGATGRSEVWPHLGTCSPAISFIFLFNPLSVHTTDSDLNEYKITENITGDY